MSNPNFIYSNLSNYNITASEAATTTGSVNNLLSGFPDEIWESSTTAAFQYLIIDLGSAQTINSIVIDNHNISTVMNTGNVSLSGADDASFTTNVVIAYLNMVATDQNPILYTFSPITRRYWKLIYNGQLDVQPYIGSICLSNKLQFPYTYNWGYASKDKQFDTIESKNIKGTIRTNQNYDGYDIYNLNFKLLNNTFKNNFITFLGTVKGRYRSFYFSDYDDTIKLVKFTNDYHPMTVNKYNLNDLLTINFKTLFTNPKIAVEYEPIVINLILEPEEIII